MGSTIVTAIGSFVVASHSQQVITFEGGVVRVAINGLALNLQGEQLKDVGRVVLEGGVIVFSAGPHPAREAIAPGRPLSDALVVFCDALA